VATRISARAVDHSGSRFIQLGNVLIFYERALVSKVEQVTTVVDVALADASAKAPISGAAGTGMIESPIWTC
jgi:hypothetical protein